MQAAAEARLVSVKIVKNKTFSLSDLYSKAAHVANFYDIEGLSDGLKMKLKCPLELSFITKASSPIICGISLPNILSDSASLTLIQYRQAQRRLECA